MKEILILLKLKNSVGNKVRKELKLIVIFGIFSFLWPPVLAAGFSASTTLDTEVHLLSSESPDLNPNVIKLGLEAYLNARKRGLDSKRILTLIDYSQPSTSKRLWVVDLNSNRILFHELVAHGQNSGGNLANSFSDVPRSLKSSLGLFVTDASYIGHHGYSLRLTGLERGFNDNAEKRDIVMHGADYVSRDFAEAYGRLGRSSGCFAIRPAIATAMINEIKNGTLLFAYYPNRYWLYHSLFL